MTDKLALTADEKIAKLEERIAALEKQVAELDARTFGSQMLGG